MHAHRPPRFDPGLVAVSVTLTVIAVVVTYVTLQIWNDPVMQAQIGKHPVHIGTLQMRTSDWSDVCKTCILTNFLAVRFWVKTYRERRY